jgi:hypothetical protein
MMAIRLARRMESSARSASMLLGRLKSFVTVARNHYRRIDLDVAKMAAAVGPSARYIAIIGSGVTVERCVKQLEMLPQRAGISFEATSGARH